MNALLIVIGMAITAYVSVKLTFSATKQTLLKLQVFSSTKEIGEGSSSKAKILKKPPVTQNNQERVNNPTSGGVTNNENYATNQLPDMKGVDYGNGMNSNENMSESNVDNMSSSGGETNGGGASANLVAGVVVGVGAIQSNGNTGIGGVAVGIGAAQFNGNSSINNPKGLKSIDQSNSKNVVNNFSGGSPRINQNGHSQNYIAYAKGGKTTFKQNGRSNTYIAPGRNTMQIKAGGDINTYISEGQKGGSIKKISTRSGSINNYGVIRNVKRISMKFSGEKMELQRMSKRNVALGYGNQANGNLVYEIQPVGALGEGTVNNINNQVNTINKDSIVNNESNTVNQNDTINNENNQTNIANQNDIINNINNEANTASKNDIINNVNNQTNSTNQNINNLMNQNTTNHNAMNSNMISTNANMASETPASVINIYNNSIQKIIANAIGGNNANILNNEFNSEEMTKLAEVYRLQIAASHTNNYSDIQKYDEVYREIIKSAPGLTPREIVAVANRAFELNDDRKTSRQSLATLMTNAQNNIYNQNMTSLNDIIMSNSMVAETFNNFVDENYEKQLRIRAIKNIEAREDMTLEEKEREIEALKTLAKKEILESPEEAEYILGKQGVLLLKEKLDSNKENYNNTYKENLRNLENEADEQYRQNSENKNMDSNSLREKRLQTEMNEDIKSAIKEINDRIDNIENNRRHSWEDEKERLARNQINMTRNEDIPTGTSKIYISRTAQERDNEGA